MNRLAALEILCAAATAEPSSHRQGCVTGGRLHPRFLLGSGQPTTATLTDGEQDAA
jgi:hypothetical protein